jgi:hypothetical protein
MMARLQGGAPVHDPQPTRSRRRFLGALALAPLVPLASGCSAPRTLASGAPASPAAGAGEESAAADPYRALRDQPLSPGAEPALAFRALRHRGSAR